MDMLVDNHGYTYTVRRQTAKIITWACTTRACRCYARATQQVNFDSIRRNSNEHTHPPTRKGIKLINRFVNISRKVRKAAHFSNRCAGVWCLLLK